jgi:hypothetical protein
MAKPVVAGKIQIARIEDRRCAGQTLQNRRFEIVDHDFARHAAQRREGVLVAGGGCVGEASCNAAPVRLTPRP